MSLLNNQKLNFNCNNTLLNNTRNANASNYIFSDKLKLFYYTAYSLMFFIGIVGNSLVIYFVCIKNTRRKTNFEIHITSLAVADLLVSIFLPIVMVHDLYTLWRKWYLMGDFGCKLFVPLPHINSLVSALMLVLISYDRMRIIKQTRLRKRSSNKTIMEVCLVWLISIAIVSPYMSVLNVQDGSCQDQWQEIYRFVYYTVLQCFSCFLPICMMIVIYAISGYTLLKKKIPGTEAKMIYRRRKQHKKVTQMFSMIIIIFFVMTTPYMISFFLIAYYGTFQTEKYNRNIKSLFHLQYAFYTFMGFNANINPFIYAMRYKEVTKSIRKILSSKRKEREHVSIYRQRFIKYNEEININKM